MNWWQRQWQDRPAETAFLAIAISFGLLFVFLTPPTQAADETTHFYRIYQLSEGHLLSKPIGDGYGDYLPREVQATTVQLFADIPSHYDRKFHYRQLPGFLKRRINFHDLVPVHFEGSAVYSPAGYIPQIIAVEVAKAIWPSPLLMYYLGRLADLALWTALMYAAIRWWPANKWPIFALALIPMSLSQAATLSPDATMNSLAFLFISVTLALARRRKVVSNQAVVFLFVAVIVLSLCKPVFFVLGLLPLLLSAQQLGGRQRYRFITGGIVASGLIATIVWTFLVSGYSTAIGRRYFVGADFNKKQQLLGLVEHPLRSIIVLGNTYLSSLGDLVARTFIGRLGWWDVDLPLWLVVGAYILITLAIVNREPSEARFSHRQRWLCATVFALGFLAVNIILYLTLTQAGEPYISGLQGRYFIPFAPLLVVPFAGLIKVPDWNHIAKRLFPISYVVMLTASLIIMVVRFV